jgi:HD-GYP domain-containing protein (c-di-GMP phosphodiesterase class II)
MARILLLGADRSRAVGIRNLLRRDGHRVFWSKNEGLWRSQEREVAPDVIVATLPSLEGVLPALGRAPIGFPAPLLLVQQEGDFYRDPQVDDRLVDRLASPFLAEELTARVDALSRLRDAVGARAGEPGSGLGTKLSTWFRSRLPHLGRPIEPYREVAARVAEWADRRDAFEPGHSERVVSFCAMMAEGLGFPGDETNDLLRAAALHDIGKVSLPIEMLRQEGPLAEAQRRLVQTHPARGASLLRALDPDEKVARVILCHHERPDGSGYYGKPREAVPRAAWVLAVAEVYDAMTSSRYRPMAAEEALRELGARRGTAFDADAVGALEDCLRPRSSRGIPISY